MKKFFRKVRSAAAKGFGVTRRAAAWAADVMCLLIVLLEEGVSNHVSDPFKTPKY